MPSRDVGEALASHLDLRRRYRLNRDLNLLRAGTVVEYPPLAVDQLDVALLLLDESATAVAVAVVLVDPNLCGHSAYAVAASHLCYRFVVLVAVSASHQVLLALWGALLRQVYRLPLQNASR